jgi:hypothetical protein
MIPVLLGVSGGRSLGFPEIIGPLERLLINEIEPITVDHIDYIEDGDYKPNFDNASIEEALERSDVISRVINIIPNGVAEISVPRPNFSQDDDKVYSISSYLMHNYTPIIANIETIYVSSKQKAVAGDRVLFWHKSGIFIVGSILYEDDEITALLCDQSMWDPMLALRRSGFEAVHKVVGVTSNHPPNAIDAAERWAAKRNRWTRSEQGRSRFSVKPD